MAEQRAAPVGLTGAAAVRLRSDLAAWTIDAVASVVGERAVRALDREQIVPARLAARAAGDDPMAILTRVFTLGDTVPRAALARALPSVGVDAAAASGLVAVAGEGDDEPVRALVDMRPFDVDAAGTWWVASDHGEAVTGRRLEGDHVLGVGGASLTLASITMRTPVGRVLDLGTGSGIQALHASLHAREVVATDVSERALAFARFNEALNLGAGADPAASVGSHTPAPGGSHTPARGGSQAPAPTGPRNPAPTGPRTPAPGDTRVPWDLRLGSMLEPVAGEQFDVVVSNPPFVITPLGAPSFEYRDGGMPGDGIVRTLVSSVGSVLAPGGVAQMLGNWEVRGDDWRGRLEEWIQASPVPLDAWIIQRDSLDAAEYAETWLRDAGVVPERGRTEFDAAFEAYLEDFDRRGVTSVGFGMIVLRRPLGPPTVRRLEEFEGPVASPLGPHLAAALAAHDWLATTPDARVLATAFTVAPDVTRETYGRPLDHDPEHIVLRQGGGFGRSVRADTALAGFVGACDGELTAGQIAHALAALLDVPPGRMLEGVLPAVRELVRDGFLTR